jgi:hypothetical protein
MDDAALDLTVRENGLNRLAETTQAIDTSNHLSQQKLIRGEVGGSNPSRDVI